MREEGKVVTRTMLLERVWNYHFDPQTNIVDTHISRLRSKLNEGGKPDLIETVRGVATEWRIMPRRRSSAAYRIAFTSLGAMLIGLALLGTIVFFAMHFAFTRQLDATIASEAQTLVDEYRSDGGPNWRRRLRNAKLDVPAAAHVAASLQMDGDSTAICKPFDRRSVCTTCSSWTHPKGPTPDADSANQRSIARRTIVGRCG